MGGMEKNAEHKPDFPVRVPLKIMGFSGVLDPEAVGKAIAGVLGPQPEEDRNPGTRGHGKYTSYTFWVTLQAEGQEAALRQAISLLPGYAAQL